VRVEVAAIVLAEAPVIMLISMAIALLGLTRRNAPMSRRRVVRIVSGRSLGNCHASYSK